MRLLANWHCPLKIAKYESRDLLPDAMPHKDPKGSHRLFRIRAVSETSCQGVWFGRQGLNARARGGRKFDLLCGWARYCY